MPFTLFLWSRMLYIHPSQLFIKAYPILEILENPIGTFSDISGCFSTAVLDAILLRLLVLNYEEILTLSYTNPPRWLFFLKILIQICGFFFIVQVQYQDIVQLVSTSAINQPAYFIAVYHAQRCVVMGIRGTYNTTDILTDLNPHTEPFQHG